MLYVGDLKPTCPSEDWEIKSRSICIATRFINHPDNLPDVDMIPNCDMTVPSDLKDDVGTRYNLRNSIKAPTRLEL